MLLSVIGAFLSYVFAYVRVLFEQAYCQRYVELHLSVCLCVHDRLRENLYQLLITAFGWKDGWTDAQEIENLLAKLAGSEAGCSLHI